MPPEWHAWLHHTVDEVPRADRPRYPWEKPHQPNMTGTPYAYHPPGSILRGGRRAPRDRGLRAVDTRITRRHRTMTGNVIETVMGAVVLVVAALFLFFAYTTSQVRAVQGYQVTAQFDRVDGIRDGSDVRIAGVKVGSIVSETLDPKTFLATVQHEHRPGLQAARRHGRRDRLVGPARRQILSLWCPAARSR